MKDVAGRLQTGHGMEDAAYPNSECRTDMVKSGFRGVQHPETEDLSNLSTYRHRTLPLFRRSYIPSPCACTGLASNLQRCILGHSRYLQAHSQHTMQQYASSQAHFLSSQGQYSSPEYASSAEPLASSSNASPYGNNASPYSNESPPWAHCYSYMPQDYTMWPVNTAQYESGCSELPLYAPMPLNGPAYPRLLSNIEDDASNTSGTTSFASHESDAAIPEAKPYAATDEENPLDVYLDAPQILFPTPSELLSDLNTRSESGGGAAQIDAQEKSRSTSMSSSSGPSLAKRKRESREKPENLNQRKAYFRAVSENVGFTITDPDTITSHDKKRSYLECLEEYVQWLHEQIRLVGHEPVPLERISTYRGLRNNSLRTMLVHMQTTIRDRNVQKQRAEERFLELESALMMRTAAEESLQFRRHSIAIGAAIPSSIAPGFMG